MGEDISVEMFRRLDALEAKVDMIVGFIDLIQSAVESATSAGGVAGMMARNMFPAELSPR